MKIVKEIMTTVMQYAFLSMLAGLGVWVMYTGIYEALTLPKISYWTAVKLYIFVDLITQKFNLGHDTD